MSDTQSSKSLYAGLSIIFQLLLCYFRLQPIEEIQQVSSFRVFCRRHFAYLWLYLYVLRMLDSINLITFVREREEINYMRCFVQGTYSEQL